MLIKIGIGFFAFIVLIVILGNVVRNHSNQQQSEAIQSRPDNFAGAHPPSPSKANPTANDTPAPPPTIFDPPAVTKSAPAIATEPAVPPPAPPQPDVAPMPPTPDLGRQINVARGALSSDVAELATAEAACFKSLENDQGYKAALAEKDAASAQAREEGSADASHRLLLATQAVWDMRHRALISSPHIAVLRRRVEADEDSLVSLLRQQGVRVMVATAVDDKGSDIAGSGKNTDSSPMPANGRNEYVRGYTRRDGTYVHGYTRAR